MGCAPILNLLQCTIELGETEEELDQEEHHSVQSLQVSNEGEAHIERTENDQARGGEEPAVQGRQKVKWPASTEKAAWSKLDDELDPMLKNSYGWKCREEDPCHV